MNQLNHFLFAFILLILFFHNTASLTEILIFSIVFAAMLDLDHLISLTLLKKPFWHHRTWIQEPFGFLFIAIPIATILALLFKSYYFFLVIIPYASHIFLDYLTIHEVSPLAPFSKKEIMEGFVRPYPEPKWFKLKKHEILEDLKQKRKEIKEISEELVEKFVGPVKFPPWIKIKRGISENWFLLLFILVGVFLLWRYYF